MIKESPLGILQRISPEIVTEIIDKLNAEGFICDEIQPTFASPHMEKWNTDCDNFLRERGYNGADLFCIGNYFENHGAVYMLINQQKCSVEEAQNIMNNHVEKYDH